MEDFDQIEDAIANVLTGNDTEHDRKIVSDWARQSEINKYKLAQLRNIWKEGTRERRFLHSEEMKQKVWHSAVGRPPTKSLKNPGDQHWFFAGTWLRAAAVLFIVATVGVVISTVFRKGNNVRDNLAGNQNITVKSNPAGQKSKVFLPDGSIVWLNAESSIRYHENFSDTLRSVELSGEAFFEVKHDALVPFVVKSRDLNVRVLGTKFNVNDFGDGKAASVALTEGAVEVVSPDGGNTDRLNKSGQGIRYRPSSKTGKPERFEFSASDPLNQFTGWKDGILVFDGDNFDSFLSKVRRWYGVEVNVTGDPPKDWSIRATFNEEYLSNVLTSISFNKKFGYTLDGKKLTLIFH